MSAANVRTYDLTGLQPDTRYIISVASTVGAGDDKVLSGKETIIVTTEMDTSIPNASFLRLGRLTQQSVTLFWDPPAVSNFDTFELTYSPSFIGSPSSPVTIPKGYTEVEVTELMPGVDYQFVLRTVRGAGPTLEMGTDLTFGVTTRKITLSMCRIPPLSEKYYNCIYWVMLGFCFLCAMVKLD